MWSGKCDGLVTNFRQTIKQQSSQIRIFFTTTICCLQKSTFNYCYARIRINIHWQILVQTMGMVCMDKVCYLNSIKVCLIKETIRVLSRWLPAGDCQIDTRC